MASEIYFTYFVAEYDFSIQVRKHLPNLLKTVSPYLIQTLQNISSVIEYSWQKL